MRTIVRNVVLAAGAILLCASGTAQASPSTVLKAKVPFPFVVNGHELPAGMYRVQRDDMSSSSVLLIRGEGSNHSVAFLTATPDYGQDPAGSKPALTFKRRENEYRLASVWAQSQGWDITSR